MRLPVILLSLLLLIKLTQAQVYPPPACVNYQDGNIIICPPDSVPDYTGGLFGYNIYLDEEFLDFVPFTSPTDTLIYTFNPLPLPGNRVFCAKTVYQSWISDQNCDSTLVYYGYDIPFTEDWSSGSFETNNWTQEGGLWTITEETGNPSPSVEFQGNAGLTDYFVPLTSYLFIAESNSVSNVHIEFEVKLESVSSSGDEKLYIQCWDWTTQSWYGTPNYYGLSNEEGSFDWKNFKRNFFGHEGVIFRVRIVVEGANSNDISSWQVDNIKIYRTCYGSADLSAALNSDNKIELSWETPTGCGEYWNYIYQYTYGTNGSVGTGSQAEFDVAARWTPAMLVDYANKSVSRIYFYPSETNAIYKVRIWEGDPPELAYEQMVPDPLIDQWNTVVLDPAHPIDISQMLWIGYHIEANTGYPAGIDVGPAYDGFGNMMYWEGQWQTLIDVNPDLDYNWLIEAYAGVGNPMYCGSRIYRKINDGDYLRIADIGMTGYYMDEDADLSNLNCYMATNVVAKNNDTCESFYSNEACILPVGLPEHQDEPGILIYPNPLNDWLFIEMPEKIMDLQLLDMTGRVVFETRNVARKLAIPVDGLSNGIYLLKVAVEDRHINRKVLIR
jgi:hypothetical protein